MYLFSKNIIGEVLITFLDVKLTGSDGTVTTSLHRKSTAGNALLRADSAHPGHTIKSVPYGQFLRLKRICSTSASFGKEATDMTRRFIDRGYPNKLLNRA